ncbi:hypothetical protein HanPSC8_Chr10g0414091 [Helianthus annuus]|nr:hypothetical protein HanPSC8_Chr10g0414091 [Helianthus annuus]
MGFVAKPETLPDGTLNVMFGCVSILVRTGIFNGCLATLICLEKLGCFSTSPNLSQ